MAFEVDAAVILNSRHRSTNIVSLRKIRHTQASCSYTIGLTLKQVSPIIKGNSFVLA